MTASGSPTRMDAAARRDFEDTVLPQLDRLFGMALRLTRSRTEAEDLVQDTMIRAYRFWNSFKPGTSVRAWLFTILRNTFINRYHRSNRDRMHLGELTVQHEAFGDDNSAGQAPQALPAPEDVLAQRGVRERIEAALQRLPYEFRMVVALADIEGLSYKEVAEAMEIPVGTVMSRLHRGRKQLHTLLYRTARDHGLAVAAGPRPAPPTPRAVTPTSRPFGPEATPRPLRPDVARGDPEPEPEAEPVSLAAYRSRGRT